MVQTIDEWQSWPLYRKTCLPYATDTMSNNGYLFQAVLSQSRDSTVFLASHREGGRVYAIERIQLNSLSQTSMKAILNHSKLLHPHVLRVKEVLQDCTGLFVVNEYAQVGTLQSYLSTQPNGRLSEREARLVTATSTSGRHDRLLRSQKPQVQVGLLTVCISKSAAPWIRVKTAPCSLADLPMVWETIRTSTELCPFSRQPQH